MDCIQGVAAFYGQLGRVQMKSLDGTATDTRNYNPMHHLIEPSVRLLRFQRLHSRPLLLGEEDVEGPILMLQATDAKNHSLKRTVCMVDMKNMQAKGQSCECRSNE